MSESLQFLEANKYLIRFYYVYKYKNFNRAAENFYIQGTDRNMRYALSQLENFYSVKLVKTEGNKLDFTEFGHILGRYAEKIFNLNLEINSILSRANLKEVRFSTTPDFYEYYIKPIFQTFQLENPDIKIILLKTNQYDATQKLLNREIDFIVGSIPINPHHDLTYQEIAKAKMLLAVKKENEAKFINIKSLNDLKDYKGAINDSTDPFYYNFFQAVNDTNSQINVPFFTSDFNSLIEVVRNGFTDYSIVGNYALFDDISFIDISYLFTPVAICFIYRKGETPTIAITKLIEISTKLQIKPI